ncbi:zinc finger C2H2 domain-containing protein [Candidatus Nitrososphaera gargensis Ga9.2]|uniref:Zinc finger C2H2 domain-containing protein n=1 Tax=Nitrososphaera gargensis (strain Ga9.2) TaxID=1237085 RepID=K0IF39_NITGG|nr:C2H2-type zinc finger protein [Candidatus Nitrososphaera gargensis]AFU59976.1 zinc finger C2H2 domain-containing protein [Candidatus Nitrososphaera gargensis Ga9.2]
MVDTTETISCPICDIPFDTRDELERHSRKTHATITTKEATPKGSTPAMEERVQSRTEEKGKGETPEQT